MFGLNTHSLRVAKSLVYISIPVSASICWHFVCSSHVCFDITKCVFGLNTHSLQECPTPQVGLGTGPFKEFYLPFFFFFLPPYHITAYQNNLSNFQSALHNIYQILWLSVSLLTTRALDLHTPLQYRSSFVLSTNLCCCCLRKVLVCYQDKDIRTPLSLVQCRPRCVPVRKRAPLLTCSKGFSPIWRGT